MNDLAYMFYRNSLDTTDLVWTRDARPHAGEIARAFLSSEYELFSLQRVESPVVTDLREFLSRTAGLPLTVSRSGSRNALLTVDKVDESMWITGRTAHVMLAYIDEQPVRMRERGDMTIRRSAAEVRS